jgi:RNA-directed DNA polymerase
VGKSGLEEKSFQIPKQLVWEAYKRVKANKGAAGVDGQSMHDFEEDLRIIFTRSGIGCRQGRTFRPR